MKKFQLTVALSGTFLFRTELQELNEFKKTIIVLIPLLKSNSSLEVMFDKSVIENWTTYKTKIDESNFMAVLENLAQE